ncbi:MAG: EI24 domain-containing protein [Ideonella sp.]|nr:EI24 domain-containing protein [Ideonella sp.]
MTLMLDSFWRALAYLFMPRIIGLSLMPLLIAGGLTLAMGYFFWTDAVTAVRATLESWSLVEALLQWVDGMIGSSFRTVLAPLVVVAFAVPVVVVFSLLLVALLATPSIVSLVAERRFAALDRRHGAAAWRSAAWSLGYTVAACLALLLTMPLWLIPGVVFVLPPLIWGWLTAKVMAFDVLADHASAEERRALLKEHAWPMMVIGITTGFLGAAPTVIWAFGAMTLVFAPLLLAVSVWLYTVVFMFSALWFAHYALAALGQLRRASTVDVVPMDNPAPFNNIAGVALPQAPAAPGLPGT